MKGKREADHAQDMPNDLMLGANEKEETTLAKKYMCISNQDLDVVDVDFCRVRIALREVDQRFAVAQTRHEHIRNMSKI